MAEDYLMRTVSKSDIHTRTRTVYYLYCPYCETELDDDDISVGADSIATCTECGKDFYIEPQEI